jgi:hypothetical protein
MKLFSASKILHRPTKLWKVKRPCTPDSENTLEPSPLSDRPSTTLDLDDTISSHSTIQNDGENIESDEIKSSLPKAAPVYEIPTEQVLKMIKNCLENEPIKNAGSVLKTAHLSNLTEDLLGLADHPVYMKKFQFSHPLVTFAGPSSWDYFLMVQLEKIRQEAMDDSLPTVGSDQEDWDVEGRTSVDSVTSQEFKRIPNVSPMRQKRKPMLNINVQQLLESEEQISAVTVDSIDDLWDGSKVAQSIDFSLDMENGQIQKRNKVTLRRKTNFEKVPETSFESLHAQVISMETQIMQWKKQIQPLQPLKPILKRKSKFVKDNDTIQFIPTDTEPSFVEMSDSDSISLSTITAGTSFNADSISVDTGSSIMLHGDLDGSCLRVSTDAAITVKTREFITKDQFLEKQLPMSPQIVESTHNNTPTKESPPFDPNYIKHMYQPIHLQKEPFRPSLEFYSGSRVEAITTPRMSVDSMPNLFEALGLSPIFKSKAKECQKCNHPQTIPVPLVKKVETSLTAEKKKVATITEKSPKNRLSMDWICPPKEEEDVVRIGVKPKRSKVKAFFQKLKTLF